MPRTASGRTVGFEPADVAHAGHAADAERLGLDVGDAVSMSLLVRTEPVLFPQP